MPEMWYAEGRHKPQIIGRERRHSRSEQLHEGWEEKPEAMEAAEPKKNKSRTRRGIMGTVCILIAAVAAAFLAGYAWMPVLQIYGKSMTPTLAEGEVVVTIKTSNIQAGDIIAFDLDDKILIRRVIGVGGDEIHIAENGTVSVNNQVLEEPYVSQKDDGDFDITIPYQVPAEEYFVMGDERTATVDSRHVVVGCVTQEQVIGKAILRVWPLSQFGTLK